MKRNAPLTPEQIRAAADRAEKALPPIEPEFKLVSIISIAEYIAQIRALTEVFPDTRMSVALGNAVAHAHISLAHAAYELAVAESRVKGAARAASTKLKKKR